MATGKKPVMPTASTLLFTIHLLFAFLGERTCGDSLSQSSVKARKDGKGSNLQMDIVATAVAAEGSDENRILPGQNHGIRFEPALLDFKEQSVGMPKKEVITVHNPSQSQPLHLNSISGDSPAFHASFFRSKVLKAGESTTFEVIFLARVVESVQTTLYIQTSLGTFDYRVQGVGVPNKFRLRSLLGARIPVNATYSPAISMYNPFNTSLQITEMYSSGGELHLELLTGQPHGMKSLWEIRPFDSKTIGRAQFYGRVAANHTSFIRIKTSHTSQPSIVLPVEVEVLETPSLYLSRDRLDFGLLRTGDSKSLPLYLLNTASHQVHIKAVTIVPDNRAIEVEYTSIILKPGSKYTKIAVVTFHCDRVTMPQQTSGVLVIKADGRTSHQLEVPFEANVLQGSLSVDKQNTYFKVGRPPFHPVVREIALANRFRAPVVIYDVKLPSKAQEYFTVASFTGPFIIPPDAEWHYPFSIQFQPTSSDCLFNTTVRLTTNSTFFSVPLFCYDGRVKYSIDGVSSDEDTLDYGVLSELDSRSKTFTLHNLNPVEIEILDYRVSSNLPHTTIELFSLHSTNLSTPPAQPPSQKTPFSIDMGHSASFRVNVTRPSTKGTFSGEVLVNTSFDNIVHVPIYYKTIAGGLKVSPEFVDFDSAFPYGEADVDLYVTNLYHQPVAVTSVRVEPADARLGFSKGRKFPLKLQPKDNVQIGQAVFDPLGETGEESVYLGMGDNGSWSRSRTTISPASTTTTTTTTKGSGANLSDLEYDLKQFSSLRKAYSALVEEGTNVLNFSYVVTSDVGSELSVPGCARLVWPGVLDKVEGNLIEFPTTTISTSHSYVFNVTNPSRQPLSIQPVLLQHYTKSETGLDLFSEHTELDIDLHPIQTSSFAFSRNHALFDTDLAMVDTVIQPGDDPYQVTVAFSPKVDALAETVLLIRNNLTVLDYVVLKGRGIQGVFSIDGIQPGSEPLEFEFTQSMMERCHAGSLYEPMKISRVFSMYNSGSTPLTLYLVGVGEGGREEGGFSVLNFHREIIIKPNKTKSIEISFVPDFTISRVSNTLRFKTTSGTELLFPLLAILPHNLLAVCYAMQPRPEWEQTIAWLSVPFWICVIVTMVAVVLVQTNFGVNSNEEVSYQNDQYLPMMQATGGPVFDLRGMADGRATPPEPDRAREAERVRETERGRESVSNRKSGLKAPETLKPSSGHQHAAPVTAHPSSSSSSSKAQSHSSHTPPPHTRSTHTPPPPLHTPSPHRVEATPTRAIVRPVQQASSGSLESKTLHQDQTTSATEKPSVSLHPAKPVEKEKSVSVEFTKKATSEKTLVVKQSSAPNVAQSVTHPSAGSGTNRETHSATPPQGTKPPTLPPESVAPPPVAPVSADTKPAPANVPKPLPKPQSGIGSESQAEPKPEPPVEPKVAPGVQSTPPQVVSPDNTSPTTGVHPSPLSTKKQKSSRKSSSKAQKGSVEPTAPSNTATATTSSPPAPVPVPLPAQASRRDVFERKESESSLKSTDSESTTSSLEKSEEKENSEKSMTPAARKEAAVVMVESAKSASVSSSSESQAKPQKPRQLPLTKEPNTGQTVHVADPSPGSADPANEEDTKKEVGSLKGKSRRKVRQQQKKEEKSKKKEREKASQALRVKDKVDKSQGANVDSPHAAAEHFDEEAVLEVTAPKPMKLKILQSPSAKLEQNQRSRSKVVPVKQAEPVDYHKLETESPVVVQRSSSSSNIEKRDISPPVSIPTVPLPSKSAILVSAKPVPPLPSKSAPAKSVPSTAIKSSRSGGVSSKQYSEDIISDPFSRNPDRSTYARKKATTKKSSEKGARSSSEDAPVILAKQQSETELETDFESKQEPRSLEGSEESLEDVIDSSSVSPDASEEVAEVDPQHKAGLNPSSPHDLAASLLSKIAIPVKTLDKVRTDRAKRSESLEYEDDDDDVDTTLKSEDAKLSDSTEEISPPGSYSPTKDGGPLSSPSPPLSNDQYKGSSLSLDAEPFYPSSNFKSRKHSKSDRKSSERHEGRKGGSRKGASDSGEARMGHAPKMGSQPQHHHHHRRPPMSAMEGTIPPVGPMDKAMLDRAEFYHRSEKHSPPSPPFPYGDPSAYRYNEMMYEGQDPVAEYRRPPERDPSAYYGSMEEAMLHDRARHDHGGMDPAFYMQKAGRVPHASGQRMSVYPQQQGFHHVPPNYPRSSSGYPPDSRMYDDDFKRQQFIRKKKFLLDLYRQERAALAAVYAREQARKSAEALTSLHRPIPPGHMGGFPSDIPPPPPPSQSKHPMGSGSPANLWDDYLDVLPPPPPHPPSSQPHPQGHHHMRGGFDDPIMGNEAEPHHLANAYLFSDLGPSPSSTSSQMPPPPPPQGRSRNFSETSDIGGEILSNYPSPGVQSPTAVGPPGYKRAPGAEYSRLEQEQEALGKESTAAALMLEQHRKHMTWPTMPDGEDAAIGSATEWGESVHARESWMMEPPPTTNPRTLGGGGGGNSATATPSTPLNRDLLSLPLTPDLQPRSSNLSSSTSSSMYALFENQSIWSLSNSGSESSNLLSWAMLGAAEQEQQGKSEKQ